MPFVLDNSRAKKVSSPLNSSKDTLIFLPPCDHDGSKQFLSQMQSIGFKNILYYAM